MTYLEHVRAMLRTATTGLQIVAITGWSASLLVNPEVERGFGPATLAMLLALGGVCTWKALTPKVQRWRTGTLLYAILLVLAFRMELDMMRSQSELLTLPLAILISIGFAGVIPLRRDYLLIAAVTWLLMLAGRPRIVPEGMDAGIVALLVGAALLVGFGLNHAIVASLRTTFRLKEDFRRLAETDPLTGLPNRRALMERLQAACAGPAESAWHFALLDLDDFKSINDRHGHEVGDAVLLALAEQLRTLPPHCSCGRLGGEEFGILIGGIADADAQSLLDHLLADVRTLRVREVSFSFSAGFVAIGAQECLADVLRRADEALYAAKRSGKDRVLAQLPPSPA